MEQEHQQQQQINFGRFSIFLLAKSAQNSYGVKNGDYLRYRRYCTRKIDKIRATMNYKYGNRTRFNKKDITQDKGNDKKILQICLFTAQKYWAYASQLKFAQSIKQQHKLRARFTAIKKFNRAYQWSQKLLKICKQRTDSTTVSEAQAYALFLSGLLYFQRQDWKKASSKLIGARQIINDLMQNVDTMSFKVYKQKIERIDQTIKFCNFKLSKSDKLSVQQIIQIRKVGDPNLSNLLQNITERRLKEVSLQSQDQIRFGEQRYTIKNQNIILQKSKIDAELINLQNVKEKHSKQVTDQKLYQQVLNFYGSIIILVDDAMRIVDSKKQDLKNHTKDEIDIFKKVYFLFEEIKINLLIDRNHTIFKFSYNNKNKKSAPQTLAKLLSNTTTLYSQLIDIEKSKNQAMSQIQHDKIRKIDAKVFLIRTIRLMFVGQVYFNNDKFKEAYSLWVECQRCLNSIKTSQDVNQLKLIQIQAIQQTTNIGKMKCILKHYESVQIPKDKLISEMKDMKIQQQKQHDITLYDLAIGKQESNLKLSQFQGLQIINLPGDLQPIPTRPIFYNIFQSQVEYPSLQNKIKKNKKGWWNKLLGT